MRTFLLSCWLLAGFSFAASAAELTITSQTDNTIVASLATVGGEIQTGLGITTVTLTIKEPGTAGAGDHWWNGTAWQSTVVTLPTTVTATTWTNTLGFVAPPLIGGRPYQIAVSAVKTGGATASALVNVQATVPTLNWDDGATHLGTAVHSQSGSRAGGYYFKVIAQNTAVGAWRTALNLVGGEANVYLRVGDLPSTDTYSYKSDRTGSDGFVLHSSQFGASQEWYIMVGASEGAQWNLVTGEAYVKDLGILAADASSGSGSLAMGAEGMRFFKTSVPADTLAWRLWLNGAGNDIRVKKGAVPHPVDFDTVQPGQMLLVPPYLDALTYYISYEGSPGTLVNLDSRKQAVTDIDFVSTTPATVTGYGYTTYRVQVPVQQIGWEVAVTPSLGNANLAVRRGAVPNEYLATAYSAAAGLTTDSVTLVPPTLSDGTFYITVYGSGSHTFTLVSGNPLVTDVNFTSSTVNDATTKVGWRYYRVANIDQQLGFLGWDLFLQNFPAGTEIALRRNALPGRWNALPSGGEGYVDYSGPAGFIQRPGHQADIWYVGVYNPTNILGAFTLNSQPLGAQSLTFSGGQSTINNQTPNRWQFFRVDVPDTVKGWNLRLKNITSGYPRMVIRRDSLPVDLSTSYSFYTTSTGWGTGVQFTPGTDWTGYPQLNNGIQIYSQMLIATMGYPLETGTYYVGVLNDSGDATPMSYTIESRGVGAGQAIPVNNLNFSGAGSSATVNGLALREGDYYKVTVPPNTPSWKLRLTPSAGDVFLLVHKDSPPNIGTGRYPDGSPIVQKVGKEHLLLMPDYDQTSLPAGDYYLAVVSEGTGPAYPYLGTGTASYTLESLGTLPVTAIGTVGAVGAPDLTTTGSVEGGEIRAYSMTVPTGIKALEVRLEGSTGNPALAMVTGTNLPGYGYQFDYYGQRGGASSQIAVPDYNLAYVVTIANPVATNYTFLVKGVSTGSGAQYPAASFTVRFRAIEPDTLSFNTGSQPISNQPTNTWLYYRVVVPADALGWDLRLANVTGGDPQIFVRRDLLPGGSVGGVSFDGTSWTSEAETAGTGDFTGQTYLGGVVDYRQRRLIVGMGSPLEPGIYYVGVRNNSSGAASYTLVSQGIGDGYAIPVTPLNFSGGVATINSLTARENKYYKVTIPAGMPSWKLKLAVSAGDAMFTLQKDKLPSAGRARRVEKPGNEHYLLMPNSGETSLTAGTYYLVVASQGVADLNGYITEGSTSSSTLISTGNLPIQNIGTVGASDITYTESIDAGEIKGLEFVVPAGTSALVVSQENVTGEPVMTYRLGQDLPSANAFYYYYQYGTDGGQPDGRHDVSSVPLTIANPTPGTYRMLTRSTAYAGYSDASHTIRLHVEGSQNLAFANGSATVTGQAGNTWRYFKVVVPADAAGWDLRLENVTGGYPQLTVRRDLPPDSLNGSSVDPSGTNWTGGYYWTASVDYTFRSYEADGTTSSYGRRLVMAMGHPLEPGTYYVGVTSSSVGLVPDIGYTLVSRGIGSGYQIPITPLAFTNGTATVSSLAARDAAYYRIDVPTNAPNWKLRLANTQGESMMIVGLGTIPSSGTGKRLQKDGNEHYLLLPSIFEPRLHAGETYYIAVVSEGVNPPNGGQVGTGAISAQLQSIGSVGFTQLGTIGSSDTVRTSSLEGGESRYYQFSIAEGTASAEVRLENRNGNPTMYLLQADYMYGTASQDYGIDGGYYPYSKQVNETIITLPNPSPGLYTLLIKAQSGGTSIPDADYTIRLHIPPIPQITFDSALNGNGLVNTATGSVSGGEKVNYKVLVPETFNGQPVLGWRIDLSAVQGSPYLKVEKNYLPNNYSQQFSPGTTIVTPPTLTPGVWYLELSGSGASTYSLVSSAVKLERAAWNMPVAGQVPNTPGVTPPFFADTGVIPNGSPLPNDQGIDLGQGDYHFYAVNVPAGNGALLRVQLDAISGNPDLYMKRDIIPTFNSSERSLTGTGTEYANWVPSDSRYDKELPPGIWYFAVRGGGNSNVRYRLRLSVGSMQDLALNGGSAVNQTIAAGDWRYYRVQIPQNAPYSWNVTFSQIVGDVIMHVRDTVPPGNVNSEYDLADWTTDNKGYVSPGRFDPPGTYGIPRPPLRPASTYYLGFKAVSDATFTVSSATSGGTLPTLPTIAFYGGTVSGTLAGHATALYRIDAPADALRMKLLATNSANVGLILTEGTLLDYPNTYPAWSSSFSIYSITDFYQNPQLNQPLSTNQWPWLVSHPYYLLLTNVSSSAENYFVRSDGRNAANEDGDEDGLLDAWELLYFGYIYSYSGNDDPDGDGVPNRIEFAAGTNPTNAASYVPILTVVTNGGTVAINPNKLYYAFNESVTLTATPDAGKQFDHWSGDATGNQNPLTISMTTNKYITAVFITPPYKNDNFADRYPLVGASVTTNANNTQATRETGEPFHANATGYKSLWWKWTAPATGPVTISTAGSVLDTLIGVYTGTSVDALTFVAADDDGGFNGTSVVVFNAIAGTEYEIAVDGFGGQSGDILLSLNQPNGPVNDNFSSRIFLYGGYLTTTGSNQGATVESGEANLLGHGAGKSVWWSWQATSSGSVTIDTIGSDFDTLLGIYTGSSVGSLILQASDDESGGNHTSKVTFNASGGNTYHIKVDGNSTASGHIVLNLNRPVTLPNNTLLRNPNGQFQFLVNSVLGNPTVIQVSTNLKVWSDVYTNLTGGVFNYTNSDSPGTGFKFYRVKTLPMPAP